MWLRLLLAILLLTGQALGRTCTCPASKPALPATPISEHSEHHACGCQGKAKLVADVRDRSCDSTDTDHLNGQRDGSPPADCPHDSDCPVLSPPPAAITSPSAPSLDADASVALVEPASEAWDLSRGGPTLCPPTRLRPSSTPLYISLLHLRN